MSLFQPIETLHKNVNAADVFRLGPHGCNVMFTRYDKGTDTGTLTNISDAKNRLISGTLVLTIDDKASKINAGEWYKIPANTEHSLHYLSDCSVIEFWFEGQEIPQEHTLSI